MARARTSEEDEIMMMASIVTLPVLVFTMCLTLLPIALLVVLQVFLCRKSRKLGLILPVLSLILSFVLTSVALINCVTPASASSMVTVDENGNTVEEILPQPDFYPPTGGEIAALVALFLTCNVPTAAFGGIWLYYKNRHDFQDGLRRMNIQDLE